jgi:hypothetical protein
MHSALVPNRKSVRRWALTQDELNRLDQLPIAASASILSSTAWIAARGLDARAS